MSADSLFERTRAVNVMTVVRMALREYALTAQIAAFSRFEQFEKLTNEVAAIFLHFDRSTGQDQTGGDLPAIPDHAEPLYQRLPDQIASPVLAYVLAQARTAAEELPAELAAEWVAAYRDLLISGFGVDSPGELTLDGVA